MSVETKPQPHRADRLSDSEFRDEVLQSLHHVRGVAEGLQSSLRRALLGIGLLFLLLIAGGVILLFQFRQLESHTTETIRESLRYETP